MVAMKGRRLGGVALKAMYCPGQPGTGVEEIGRWRQRKVQVVSGIAEWNRFKGVVVQAIAHL